MIKYMYYKKNTNVYMWLLLNSLRRNYREASDLFLRDVTVGFIFVQFSFAVKVLLCQRCNHRQIIQLSKRFCTVYWPFVTWFLIFFILILLFIGESIWITFKKIPIISPKNFKCCIFVKFVPKYFFLCVFIYVMCESILDWISIHMFIVSEAIICRLH